MRLSLILLIVGGLNWGSVGLLGKDLVVALLGRGTATKAVYGLVGLAALYVGLRLFGFVEAFENNGANANGLMNNANMNSLLNSPNMNAAMNANNANNDMTEGFYACKDGQDEGGKPCNA